MNDVYSVISGYYLTAGSKGYFMRTDSKKKTKTILQCFIQQIAIQRGLSNELIDRCMEDPATLERTRKEATPATISRIGSADDYYFCIHTKNMNGAFTPEIFNEKVIVFA